MALRSASASTLAKHDNPAVILSLSHNTTDGRRARSLATCRLRRVKEAANDYIKAAELEPEDMQLRRDTRTLMRMAGMKEEM